MQRKQEKKTQAIDGEKFKIAVVVSKFNQDITEKMLDGAIKTLKKNNVKDVNIKTVWVPGALEIPLACQRLTKGKKFDGILALGCVIKGETDHYHYVAGESIRGVLDVMLKFDIPIGMGIITTNNLKQAQTRSEVKNNKGSETAQAVLEMLGTNK